MKTTSMLGKLHRRIILGPGWIEYLALVALGFVPIFVSMMIDVANSRPAPLDSQIYKICVAAGRVKAGEVLQMRGFFQAYNWMLYPLMLPLALFVLRRLMGMMFGVSRRSPLGPSTEQYRSIRQRVLPLASDWRTFSLVLTVNLVIHIIEMRPVVLRYTRPVLECPADVDWGWYSLVFGEPRTELMAALITFTTLEQFILGAIALLILFNLARCNEGYLNAIYIRKSPRTEVAFVLDLDDPDRKFGLGNLALIFNLQLAVLAVVGAFFLVSRYANVDASAVSKLLFDVKNELGEFLSSGNFQMQMLSRLRAELFHDVGQAMIPGLWLCLAYVVMRPAAVKLLPFRYVEAKNGRVAYLEQFVPPTSKYGAMLATGKLEKVDTVAKVFRAHAFWPTGDTRAAERIFGCSLVCLILLFPIVPASFMDVAAIVSIIVLSLGFAGGYLRMHKYRLERVDPSLVKD